MLISPNPMAKPDTITVVLNGETIDFTDENASDCSYTYSVFGDEMTLISPDGIAFRFVKVK